jgi:hypothetical protein
MILRGVSIPVPKSPVFLVEELAARGAPEVADANRMVGLIEDAISLARGLAAGLFPLETDGGDLSNALSELAAHFPLMHTLGPNR